MSAPRKFRVWDGEGMNRVDFRLRPDGTVSFLVYDKNEGRKEKNTDSDVASTVCQTVDEEVEVGWKDDSNLVVMQYTGLTDAEGQEIWEEDIVEDKYGNRGTVKWAEGGSCWEMANYRAPNETTAEQKITVIGNRYENPELLKPADA